MHSSRFYYNEDNKEPRCVLCGNGRFTMLTFCNTCGEWFCKDTCENNWVLRGLAAAEKQARKAKKHLAERFI